MKNIAELEQMTVTRENIVELPMGIIGFEGITRYVLLAREEEEPFQWLQMLEKPNRGFLVVPSVAVMAGYEPDLSEEDVAFLGLEKEEDAMVLNIVTLRSGGVATVNMKGPIVVNRRTLVGRQVIPLNAARYDLQHPLPLAE